MDAVKNMWNKYRSWLGDKVWYKNWKVWLSVILVMGIAGAFADEDEEVEAEEPTFEEVFEVEEPEEVEEVEEPVEVEEDLSSTDIIKKAVEEELGSRLIEVEYVEETDHYNIYAKTSAISANMDRKGTYFDTTNILEEIQNEDFNSLYFEYQANFVDDFGDSEQRKGITYDLSKETVDKINFDSFLPDKLPNIADSYWQHPAFN